jgi:hypothetical protein
VQAFADALRSLSATNLTRMRVVSIEPLSSLPPAEADVAEHLGEWPGEKNAWDLRAYWLDDGDVLIAPANPLIEPGMDVVGEGSVGVVLIDVATSLHWASGLIRRA